MKVNVEIKEKINDVSYHVKITSTDGKTFHVVENGSKETTYETKEEFLKDFKELALWFKNV